jgi:dihydrofolate reductase
MRKIRIIEQISLDGVIQAPGGPKEVGDYPYGGWAAPHSDPAGGEAIVAAHGEAFDLLLGRRTYNIWCDYWPKAESSPMADSLNAATKYVATHRPDSLGWWPAEGLGPDIVEGVRRIKAKDGPDLIVWGSSTLTPALLEHGLADEILLLVFPVLLGTGKRFFSDGGKSGDSYAKPVSDSYLVGVTFPAPDRVVDSIESLFFHGAVAVTYVIIVQALKSYWEISPAACDAAIILLITSVLASAYAFMSDHSFAASSRFACS